MSPRPSVQRVIATAIHATLLLAIAALPIRAQAGRGYFVHLSSNTAAAATVTIAPPAGGSYSAAAQTNTGTIWNEFPAVTSVTNPAGNIGNPKAASATGTYSLYSAPLSLVDSTGAASPVTVAVSIAFVESNNDGISIVSQGGSSPNPAGLMGSAWRMQRGANSITYTIAGLPDANAAYHVYFYGSGNATNQGSTLTLAPANVWSTNPASAISSGLASPVSVLDVNGDPVAIGNGWNVVHGKTDGAGTLTITQGKHTSGQNFMNGFQIVRFPLATISAQPPPTMSVVSGGNASIPATAVLNGTVGLSSPFTDLTYRWRKDGVAIDTTLNPSAATATLQLTGVTNADQAAYDVVVSSEGGPVTSSACVLSLSLSAVAPGISSQPVNQAVSVGGSVTYSVVANGTSPLTYLWQKSNDNVTYTDIPGSNAAQLQIASAQSSDAGYYRVKIQNGVPPEATSHAATLTVKPVIAAQPVGAVATPGSAASVSVTVDAGAGAPEPTTFVWKLNGVTVTDGSGISGATTASLQFSSFAVANAGIYTVTASNTAGTVTSSGVYLGTATTQSVTFAPANNATGINPDAPLVVRFPSAPRVGEVGKITIRKTSDDSIVETIDLGTLTPFTSVGTPYRYATKTVGGQAGYKYFPVLIVGNEARITLRSGSVLQYGTSYYVTIETGAILDSTGATLPAITGNSTWTFTTKAAAPASISTQTTFTVAADGSGDFSTLQGALDFIPTNNATPVRINLRNGTYTELVNFGGRNKITLVGESRDQTVIEYPNNAPLNSDTTLRVAFYAKGSDLVFANLSINNSTPKGGGQAEALRSDGLRNSFLGCAFRSFQDTLLLGADNYFQDCLIQGDTDFIWGGGTAMFKNCELRAMNGGELTQARTPATRFGFVFVGCTLTRPAGSSFSYGLGRTSADATTYGNAAFIDSRMDTHISAAAWSSSFINSGFTANVRNWEYQSRDLTGTTLIDVSQRAAISRQLTSTEADTLRNPANAFGTTSDTTPAGAQGNGWVPAVAAIIHTQPLTQSANLGQQVTLSVFANAAPAPTYQWYKNATLIPGATDSTYTIASAATGDAADYTVVLTNATGAVTSAAATLSVSGTVAVPVFSTHPASQTINAGASATFTAAASGSPTYQWKKDNADISGAVSASYTVSNATTGSAASYTVVATNTGGSTTSNAAILTVNALAGPTITTQPGSQTVTVGTATSFTVVATGDAPLTYQWQTNTSGTFANISGATSATLSIAAAQWADAAGYRVIVTNGAGTATSAPATLTISQPGFAVTAPDGFANATTGGGSATAVVVTTAAALKTAAESTSPAVITVSGVINLASSGGNIRVKSNKTIQGADANATIVGNINIGSGVENVILRGLNLTNPGTTLGTDGRYTDGGDGVSIDGGKNIFITHCTVFDCADGMIDTRLGADRVTISWCEFYYTTAQTNHRFTMISDGLLNRDPVTDAVISAGAPLRITMHHNWWSDRCDQRMPSSTNGHIHLYNNYWNTPGNSYASVARDMAQFLSEQNTYENVNSPIAKSDNNALLANGLIRTIGNRYVSVTGTPADAGTDTVFTPTYSYKLQPVTSTAGLDVKTLVLAHAGNIAGLNSVSPAVLAATVTGPSAGNSQAVAPGDSTTFTAAFTGFTAASYQWRLNNFLITGATSSPYALTGMDAAKAGAYTVAITLANGETVISAPFTVTLGASLAPAITTQPANVTVTAGASASFTVVATGSPAPTYQWRKAGVNIAGANAASYSIASTAASDAGQYTVVVTNAADSVTSNAATLTVNAVPPTPPPASGGGGGGAPSWWFLGALALTAVWRRVAGARAR